MMWVRHMMMLVAFHVVGFGVVGAIIVAQQILDGTAPIWVTVAAIAAVFSLFVAFWWMVIRRFWSGVNTMTQEPPPKVDLSVEDVMDLGSSDD